MKLIFFILFLLTSIQISIAQEVEIQYKPSSKESALPRTMRRCQELQHKPRSISKEVAKSYIEEMWFKQHHYENVEVRDDRMIAYKTVVKAAAITEGSITIGGASKSGPNVVFFREIKEIRIIIKKKLWYVLLYNNSGFIIRIFHCNDESLALRFVDAVYSYIDNLPHD